MNLLPNILAVALGGAIGAVARYLISQTIQEPTPSAFPFGTLTVNLVGCLLIGILYGIANRNMLIDTHLKLLLITGFCGGFTTFSAFSHETIRLLQQGQLPYVMLYIGLSVMVGAILVFIGMKLVGE